MVRVSFSLFRSASDTPFPPPKAGEGVDATVIVMTARETAVASRRYTCPPAIDRLPAATPEIALQMQDAPWGVKRGRVIE